MIDQIKKALIESIDDLVLVSSEKKDIKNMIKSVNLSKRESDLLRSDVFKLAKSKINSTNYEFIVDWIESTNKLLLTPATTNGKSEKVYFSPGEHCLNAILNQIKLSNTNIDICLFTISDDRISNELIYKHKKGVSIRIITDNDKLFDKGSDVDKLASAGIPIKVDVTDNHMHHKFAMFDSKKTLTGSYNWTRSAERYNHENILITDSQSVVSEFKREFSKLWKVLVRYDEV